MSDDRVRAARAAVDERARLIAMRPQLAAQVAHQDQLVQQLQMTLAREQAEADRLRQGVGTFLNELLGGQTSQRDQGLQQAAARVQEEYYTLAKLSDQLAQLDARLGHLASAPAELEEARAAKERDLDARSVAALQELDIQVMAIDIELAPLQEAITAGTTALAAVVDLSNGLDEITTLEESRKIVKATRARAAETEERMRVFEHQIAELAEAPLDIAPARPGEADLAAWTEALFLRGDLADRIAAARADLSTRIERIRARLHLLEKRHHDVSARRSAVFGQRAELIDNAQ